MIFFFKKELKDINFDYINDFKILIFEIFQILIIYHHT